MTFPSSGIMESPSFTSIESIDFSMIKLKLQDEEEGVGWDQQTAEEAEVEYRRFLMLKKLYPDFDIVPNKMIDQFWHQHILDTEKYAKDCDLIFGRFMHHYPYFGMNGVEDAQNLTTAFNHTKNLYRKHFNENYGDFAKRCKAPKCRTQCKPMKCK